MKHIVYKTTNLVNDKFYVGVHGCMNPDVFDGYLGSGKVLLLAIKKYGKENFIRETLFEYETYEEVFLKEHRIVDKKFLEKDDVYNLRVGGFGCSGHCEETKLQIRNSQKGENGYWYGKHFSEDHKRKISGAGRGKKNHNYGKHLLPETLKKLSEVSRGERSVWFGKHHTEETKKKMSDAKKGEKNYMYGKRGRDTPRFGMHHSDESKKKMSVANSLSLDIVEQRRSDITQEFTPIFKKRGWSVRLREKWGINKHATRHFIKKYALDLVRE